MFPTMFKPLKSVISVNVMVCLMWSPGFISNRKTLDDASVSEEGSQRTRLNIHTTELENITLPVNTSDRFSLAMAAV